MKLNYKEISKIIKSSLISHPDSWEYDGYTIKNRDIGIKIWICNGPGCTTIMKFDSVGAYGVKKLRQPYLNRLYIYSIFLKKKKRIPYFLTYLFYLIMMPLFPFSITSYLMHKDRNRDSAYDELEFNLSKSEYREQRLSKILERYES